MTTSTNGHIRSMEAIAVSSAVRRFFLTIGFFSFSINILTLVVPIYTMQVYDRFISTKNTDTLFLLSIIAFFALLTMLCLDLVRGRIAIQFSGWLDNYVGIKLLTQEIRESRLNYQERSSLFLRELQGFRRFISSQELFPILDALWIPLFILVLYLFHPSLALVALVGATVLLIIAGLQAYKSRELMDSVRASLNNPMAKADSIILNAETIATMNITSRLLNGWFNIKNRELPKEINQQNRLVAYSASARFIRMFFQLLLIAVGGYLVTIGELSGGGIIASSIIFAKAMSPLEYLVGGWMRARMAQSSYHKILDVLNRSDSAFLDIEIERPKGRIILKEVSVVIPEKRRRILGVINLNIQPGRCVGIIGPSGSGKSTLARILVGARHPSSGNVSLDNTDLSAHWGSNLGHHIGYLPQNSDLYYGSIIENINGTHGPVSKNVTSVTSMLGAQNAIKLLEEGFNTIVEPSDKKISSGLKQQITIARAIHGNRSLVVLDEPDANLDANAEKALIETIRQLKSQGTTVIIVSHRPTVISITDDLLLLNDGRVTSYGSRDEILSKIAPGMLRLFKTDNES